MHAFAPPRDMLPHVPDARKRIPSFPEDSRRERFFMKRRRVVVLGATGSIGQSAAKVARDIPERMEVVGMSANLNVEKLAELAAEFPRAKLCVTDCAADVSALPTPQTAILRGDEGLIELA